MLALIAAMAKNYVMGKDGDMPWHLPADLKHFKAITLGKPVIMGRKTWESLGRALPGRLNIVITRDLNYSAQGASVVNSLESAISLAKKDHEDIMIIGGAQIYQQALDRVDTMYLTYIDLDVPGDTFFPKWDESLWHGVSCEKHLADDKNRYDYQFITFKK